MIEFKDTRKHIKSIIRQMISRNEIPSVNSVMNEIVRQRRAAGVDGSPSTTTVHSEIKDYFENEFWPVFRTYKGLSEVPEGLSRVHDIFQDGFSKIVLSCMELANIQYEEERLQNEHEFQKICTELETVKTELLNSRDQYISFKGQTESIIHELEVENQLLKEGIAILNRELDEEKAQVSKITRELVQQKIHTENEVEQANMTRRKLMQEIDTARQEAKTIEKKFAEKSNELAATSEQIKHLLRAKQDIELANETLKMEVQRNIERIGELRGQLQERERLQEAGVKQLNAPLRRLRMSTAARIKSVKRLKR